MNSKLAIYDPPDHLSESSKALWREVVPARARSAERRALIVSALEARDRTLEAGAILLEEGLFSKEEGAKMAHTHPAYRVEKESRAQFMAAWRELGFSWNQIEDGRH